MLEIDNAVLVIIDVQGKLASLMHRRVELFENLRRIIQGVRVLGIPVLWNEQLPDKLGPTVPEIKELLSDMEPLAKSAFSCCGNEDFLLALKSINHKQVLVAGIEAHVCVYQTCMDLLQAGYEVHLLADATSSRTETDYKTAVNRIRDEGAKITSVEMALFEMLKVAEGEQFKQIIKIVK